MRTLDGVKFYLRDRDPEMVRAWEGAFDGIDNVEISCGDILPFKANAIVSPANSFGFMDGGIDLVYTKYFGQQLPDRLQRTIKEHYGEIPVGQALIVPTGLKQPSLLICAPTMTVPMGVSGTRNAFLAFRAAILAVRDDNEQSCAPIRSILCPGLATGVGNLGVERCAAQMRKAYDIYVLGKVDYPNSIVEAMRFHARSRGVR